MLGKKQYCLLKKKTPLMILLTILLLTITSSLFIFDLKDYINRILILLILFILYNIIKNITSFKNEIYLCEFGIEYIKNKDIIQIPYETIEQVTVFSSGFLGTSRYTILSLKNKETIRLEAQIPNLPNLL